MGTKLNINPRMAGVQNSWKKYSFWKSMF